MAWEEDARRSLGSRLHSARKLANKTLEGVAAELTALGLPTVKQTVGAWEKGRNVPDSLVLRRLAKLYGTTSDALLWDEAISIEAIRFAVQYDALNDQQQRMFRTMWLAFFEQAKSDAEMDSAIRRTVAQEESEKPAAARLAALSEAAATARGSAIAAARSLQGTTPLSRAPEKKATRSTK